MNAGASRSRMLIARAFGEQQQDSIALVEDKELATDLT